MSSTNATSTPADRVETLVLQGCESAYYANHLDQHVTIEVTGLPIPTNEVEVQ